MAADRAVFQPDAELELRLGRQQLVELCGCSEARELAQGSKDRRAKRRHVRVGDDELLLLRQDALAEQPEVVDEFRAELPGAVRGDEKARVAVAGGEHRLGWGEGEQVAFARVVMADLDVEGGVAVGDGDGRLAAPAGRADVLVLVDDARADQHREQLHELLGAQGERLGAGLAAGIHVGVPPIELERRALGVDDGLQRLDELVGAWREGGLGVDKREVLAVRVGGAVAPGGDELVDVLDEVARLAATHPEPDVPHAV